MNMVWKKTVDIPPKRADERTGSRTLNQRKGRLGVKSQFRCSKCPAGTPAKAEDSIGGFRMPSRKGAQDAWCVVHRVG